MNGCNEKAPKQDQQCQISHGIRNVLTDRIGKGSHAKRRKDEERANR